jgi:hypothetical protein
VAASERFARHHSQHLGGRIVRRNVARTAPSHREARVPRPAPEVQHARGAHLVDERLQPVQIGTSSVNRAFEVPFCVRPELRNAEILLIHP